MQTVSIKVTNNLGQVVTIEVLPEVKQYFDSLEIEITEDLAREYNELVIIEKRNGCVYERHNLPLSGAMYDGDYFIDDMPDICQQVVDKELLNECLSILKPTTRAIVEANWLYGYTLTEIAKQEHKSVEAIRRLIERAMDKMQRYANQHLC